MFINLLLDIIYYIDFNDLYAYYFSQINVQMSLISV